MVRPRISLGRPAGETDVFAVDVAVAPITVEQGDARRNAVEHRAELWLR